MPPTKKMIDANIVHVEDSIKPVEAAIVEDKRSSLGKRLGQFAIALLLLFFAISGYIQSAQNNTLLHRAAMDRSTLIQDNKALTKSNKKITKSNKRIVTINIAQNKRMVELENLLRQQNYILRQHGFEAVVIPPLNYSNSRGNTSSNNQTSGHKKSSNNHHKPNNHPKPHPSHSPKPDPSPTPGPDIKKRACKLTGICLDLRRLNVAYHQQQSVRYAQVDCTSRPASLWHSLFCFGATVWLGQW